MRAIRLFFYKNKVLEVDTPTLSAATVPDPFIESFHTHYYSVSQRLSTEKFYLHTSPEFPMKRLLASGSGSIFQVSKVFRQGESGKKHNPEFTLLEWYRDGWDHHQLMQEVNQLLVLLLENHRDLAPTQSLSYADAFWQKLAINPHTVSKQELIACTEKAGLANVLSENEHQDRFLELLFSHLIEPDLGKEGDKACLCFLYHYPASQASLAKTAMHNGQLLAERFEVFIDGLEIGNGFHELTDAQEQRRRFAEDNEVRMQAGLELIPMDENFLAALEHLPDCAGVAIGLDRLLMIMGHVQHINEVLAFPIEQA